MKDLTLIPEESLSSRILGFLARRRRARSDTRHLAALDDYLLRDIGLTRDDIERPSPAISDNRF
jgi:uncharacterized protein YjiS (DUF1127 family)